MKNAVYVDGTAAQLGNEDADAEWSIRSHGSLRAVLDSCAELKPEASQLWKLTSVAEGLAATEKDGRSGSEDTKYQATMQTTV